jgi:protein TonB
MRAIQRLSAILLVVVVASACSSRPTAEIDNARAAQDRAVAAGAGQHAPDSLNAADAAQAALDAELAAQEARWFKSYDRARELAETARSASDKAAADAVAGKERADAAAAAAVAKARADAETRAALAKTAVRVGGTVRSPAKTRDVTPVYPAIAKANRIGGTVQVELTIGPDGKVADAQVVKSVPILDQAALDAVRQWEYSPTRIKGVAVPVIIDVAINFQP